MTTGQDVRAIDWLLGAILISILIGVAVFALAVVPGGRERKQHSHLHVDTIATFECVHAESSGGLWCQPRDSR